jgi:hypothetical protein
VREPTEKVETVKRYVVVCAVALSIAPAALADGSGDSGAAAACKALQTTAPSMFGAGKTYKNLGACVSTKSQQGNESANNAAKTCKAEQADGNFAGSHGGKSFSDFYGTSGNGNGNGKSEGKGNAFGKCVSGRAKTETAKANTAELNAAKQCKAQRADTGFAGAHGGTSFADFYGTNGNKKNAFGKCVAKLATQHG